MKERETGVDIVAEDRVGPWLWSSEGTLLLTPCLVSTPTKYRRPPEYNSSGLPGILAFEPSMFKIDANQ